MNENYINEINSIHNMYIKQLQEQDKTINNLQSKIDKANEILNRPQFEYNNIPCNYENDIEELKNVLKEAENVENN